MSESERPEVLRAVTPEVIAEAKALIAGADHAVLASSEAGTGWPMASRVGLATLNDGTPIIFISGLAAHRAAIEGEPRCTLLVGVPGKGDPLAHPRITLFCTAVGVDEVDAAAEARRRYLEKNPKAQLYLDLPDFRFFRMEIVRASFNGGFGRAYRVEGKDLAG